MKHWQKRTSEYILDTPYMKVRRDTCELPDGQVIDDYYVVENNDIVLIVGITTTNEFILVEQYKHAYGGICLEIVGGICESDDIETEAKREFREETGYHAQTFIHLSTLIHNPTRMTNKVHYFLAHNSTQVSEQDLDDLEDITLHLVPKHDILNTIREGKVNVSDSIAGLFLALDYLSRIK